MGAERVGRTRRDGALYPLLIIERGMRRQPSPDNFTGNTKLVEQLGGVLPDPPAKHVAFPGSRGNFVTLQLLDDVQRAVRPMKLRAGLQMLPVIQEAHEIARVHRLDFAAQPPERQTVNAREHASIAPLDLGAVRSCRCGKAPAQNLPFGLESKQRRFHDVGRQRKSL